MYNKLFAKIVDSSIWLESTPTRLVWMMLIALMDEDGFCQFACVDNVSARARLSIEETNEAIKTLESPDVRDPEQEYEGRRIERVPGGWIVLNAGKYRDLVTREIAKERNRQRVAKCREAKRGVMKCNAPVMSSNGSVTQSEAVSVSTSEAVPPTLPGAKAPPGSRNREATEVLNYLNEKAGRSFRPIETNLRLIRARLAEDGVTLDGCRVMIDRQIGKWRGTPHEEFLRPETLFNATKFAAYYDQRELPLPPADRLTGRAAEFERQATIHTKSSGFRDANGNPV